MDKIGRPRVSNKDYYRLFYSIHGKTAISSSPQGGPTKVRHRNHEGYGKGNKRVEEKWSDREIQSQNGVPVTNVFSAKAKRKSTTNIRPEATEFLLKPTEVQISKSGSDPKLPTGRRLHGEVRSISGIFSYPHKREPQKVPLPFIQKPTISNGCTAIRPVQRTLGFLPGDKLGCKHIESEGLSSLGLSRRLPLRTSGPSLVRDSDSGIGRATANVGLVRKPAKICCQSRKTNRVFRNNLGHREKPKAASRREDSRTVEGTSKPPGGASVELAKRCVTNRQTGICVSGNASRASIYKASPEIKPQAPRRNSKKDVRSARASEGRLLLVDRPPSSSRQIIYPRGNDFYDDRCFQHGLGCSRERPVSFRQVDRKSAGVAHKPKRIIHRVHCSGQLSGSVKREIDNGPVRQQNSSLVPEKPGWNTISNSFRGNKEDTSLGRPPEDQSSFFLHSGSLQYNSRLPFERTTTTGLAPRRGDYDEDISKMGLPPDRPFRYKSVESSTSVCDDRCKRSSGDIHQCVQSRMAVPAGMGIPTSTPDSQSATTPKQGIGVVSSGGTPLGACVLAGRSEAPIERGSLSDLQCEPTSDRLVNQSPSTEVGRALFRGLEGTGWSQLISTLDPEDVSLLQSAWRDSTWRTYESAWKQWISWCRKNRASSSSPQPQELATYLGFLERVRKLAYATILVHKSVIVTLADPMQENHLSSHPIVKAMLKAISVKRFAAVSPKNSIWNIQDLLQWLRSHVPSGDSIYQVSRHVALLLLLASGRRVHDLTLLHIDGQHCEVSNASITFWPSFGSKTDGPQGRQSGWELSSSDEQALDIVKWVRCLIEVSSSRRKARDDLTNLFITTRGEVKAASRTVIAGWLKVPFRELGINHSPGSIRSAVASNDFNNNVPVDEILKRGNWRRSDTFFRHYCRAVEKPRGLNSNLMTKTFRTV